MHLSSAKSVLAASIKAAHPVDGTRARATGNHLVAQNDEPEPDQPVECTSHDITLVRAYAVEELRQDGYPSGFFDVTEDSRCACGAWRTRRVPGIRARSAAAAMELYRAGSSS